MTEQAQRTRRSAATVRCTVAAAFAVLGLASCGGGNDNPLDNPNTLSNPTLTGNQRLRFSYFQTCVFPIFQKLLPIRFSNGDAAVNTCSASGCHDNSNGTGGAFRVIPNAQPIDLTNPANTADIIRASDMYKNFYSAQGEVVFGSALTSRLLAKPMVNGVLHGGGLVFQSAQDPDARLIQYWINNPSAIGSDEFSDPTFGFTPGPVCNSQ
jgi:predicted CxxxxCH...CXXCH cytochrome family protein